MAGEIKVSAQMRTQMLTFASYCVGPSKEAALENAALIITGIVSGSSREAAA